MSEPGRSFDIQYNRAVGYDYLRYALAEAPCRLQIAEI
jgi:hypothetical protein